jgi:predicted RND superfamily exporter protein
LNTKKFWYDLYRFERNIKSIPGIKGVESLTPMVFKVALKYSVGGIRPEAVFQQMQMKTGKRDILRSYFGPDGKTVRLIVHIESQTSDQIEAVLKQVKKEAEMVFATDARVTLSGQLILLRSQTTDLVSSQLFTLLLAFFVITGLMMVQLNSVWLGLLSLIPNLFPLITIFGIMGWFRIPLDPLTIFAAVISFGLSVDDSIHYLTQLKREMNTRGKTLSVEVCLKRAYNETSRAVISTTAVLFLSAQGLVFSSFSHVVSLGVLIAAASLAALMGDLVFMPAVVKTFKPLSRILSKKMKNRIALNPER